MVTSEQVLDLTESEITGLRPQAAFDNTKTWTRADISAEDWNVTVNAAAARELEAAVALIRKQVLPVYMLDPRDFEFTACHAMMAEARRKIDDAHGFAVIDRLPLDDWTEDEGRAVYWLLARSFSNPVAQNAYGQIFREIRDEGIPSAMPVVDGALTQSGLNFHQDNSGNRNMPNYTGLLSLHKAKDGGMSEYCTLYSLYNAMLEDAPVQLDRLFEPFYHDRLNIQSPGEVAVLRAPALRYDGKKLTGRYSTTKIPAGYKKAGEEMDNLSRDALMTAMAVIGERKLSAEYMLERGQIVFINNREGLHHRANYSDGDTVEEKRHLVRLWFRNEGRPFFDG